MLVSAAAQAVEEVAAEAGLASDMSWAWVDTLAESPIDVDFTTVLASLAPAADRTAPDRLAASTADARSPDSDHDAPGPVPAVRASDPIATASTSRWRVHATDGTDGTFASSLSDPPGPRIRTFSLALDAVLPRSGITIQPRVQLAYRPRDDGLPNPAMAAMPPDAGDTGVALRLYGAQPGRTAGVYPFVEADWWQDSRKQTININGTRIDADLLRGLFSFNVGAHGSTRSGVKVWVKIKTGRNAGGIIGARYRW